MKNKDKIKNIKNVLGYFLEHLKSCELCPRACGVNRLKKETGFCGMANDLTVYTAFIHRGEEPPIIGKKGSGTIFFSGCNLKCVYCQNFKFSHKLEGRLITKDYLAQVMLDLENRGAENINFVTPTHFLPQILESLLIACEKGLNIPIVYNSSGYERPEIIEKLEKIVDIYLADMKYHSPEAAFLGSKTRDYPSYNKGAILRMYNQRKTPVWQENGLKKGLIIRHLILPTLNEDSRQIIKWIKDNTPSAYISIMFQYKPYFEAKNDPRLGRKINYEEYAGISQFVENMELNGWIQEFEPPDELAGIHFKPF